MDTRTLEHISQDQVIAALTAAWNSHDIDRILSLVDANYEGMDVCHPGTQRGAGDARSIVEMYLRAFPDIHFTVDQLISQGNNVAVRWTARGTQLGTILGVPATGKKVLVCGVSMLEVDSSKVRRGQHIWDVAAMLRELGFLPDL